MHLRIRKKTGLFFLLRPYLRRRGLWAGLLLFVPLLLWSQSLVWAVDASGLTTGQQARAASVLRETVSLMPGSIVTQEKLAAGEYALLQSGEFSWVSLNFQDGRLELEAAEAKPVPEIAAGTLHGLRAKAAGTVVSTNLVSGTMLVVPGQAVEKGQGLIGTARAERDGTLIFQPAAGSVRAQFEWEFAEELPLTASTYQLTGNTIVQRRLFLAGRVFPLPSLFSPADDSTAVTRQSRAPHLLLSYRPCKMITRTQNLWRRKWMSQPRTIRCITGWSTPSLLISAPENGPEFFAPGCFAYLIFLIFSSASFCR